MLFSLKVVSEKIRLKSKRFSLTLFRIVKSVASETTFWTPSYFKMESPSSFHFANFFASRLDLAYRESEKAKMYNFGRRMFEQKQLTIWKMIRTESLEWREETRFDWLFRWWLYFYAIQWQCPVSPRLAGRVPASHFLNTKNTFTIALPKRSWSRTFWFGS